VSNNPLGKKGAEYIEEAIDRNEFVVEFDVRGCEFGKQSEDNISAWVKRNSNAKNRK
jgi:hypothetical protein